MDRTKSDLGLNSYNQYSRLGEKEPENLVKRIFFRILHIGIVTWVLLFAIWAVAAHFNSPTFLPSPLKTLEGIPSIAKNGVLYQDIKVSLIRVLKGWSMGIVFAIPLGLFVGRFEKVGWLLDPLLNFFRFIPAIGFITLFLMWFGVGEGSKTALIFYATIFPVLLNTITGVRSIDASLVEAAESLGASGAKIFFTIIVPSTVPNVFTGVRLGLSGAIISIVAAEMLAASEGIGYLIYTSRLYYRTDWIFVGIVLLGIIGFLADRFLLFLGKKFLKRYGVAG